MDDSPRNPLKGTLFRNKITDLLQERTTAWRYAGGAAVKIGELITTEQLQWRSIPRTRLDGSFRGLIQSAKWISMLNFFTYSELTGLYFLFGTLQINYRQNKLTCSAWEIMADGEVDVDDTYTFTYIYDAT